VTTPGIDPGTVRLVAQCLNHYATLGPYLYHKCLVKYSVQEQVFRTAKGVELLEKYVVIQNRYAGQQG